MDKLSRNISRTVKKSIEILPKNHSLQIQFMRHKLSKLALYFNKKDYWTLSDNGDLKVPSELGKYFLNLKDRLEDQHYDQFNTNGLPIEGITDGKATYNYTTICSYALANWQLYLETGDEKHTAPLFKTIDFLYQTASSTDYSDSVFLFAGKLSSMNQGEALSVLARGYEFNQNEAYIDFAKKIILPFDVSVEKNGVKAVFEGVKNGFWYEEYPQNPPKHVLNGMIYSLVGLQEIYQVMPQLTLAKDLFDEGVTYVEKALPFFDKGKWSWYWVAEQNTNYTASAMYHNLHICQLNYLYNTTRNPIFGEYAKRFESYSQKCPLTTASMK